MTTSSSVSSSSASSLALIRTFVIPEVSRPCDHDLAHGYCPLTNDPTGVHELETRGIIIATCGKVGDRRRTRHLVEVGQTRAKFWSGHDTPPDDDDDGYDEYPSGAAFFEVSSPRCCTPPLVYPPDVGPYIEELLQRADRRRRRRRCRCRLPRE